MAPPTHFFKLPQLPLRDTRRETRRFQGGPGRGGRPGTFFFLSWCLSEGVVELEKVGEGHITNFFLRAPALYHSGFSQKENFRKLTWNINGHHWKLYFLNSFYFFSVGVGRVFINTGTSYFYQIMLIPGMHI
jgi:hypothetical protein